MLFTPLVKCFTQSGTVHSKCIHKYSVQYLKLFFCKLDIVCGSNVAAKNIQIIGFCL